MKTIDRHSTVAEFELVKDGRSHRLSQVASTFVIFDRPVALVPGEADLLIRVDGEQLHRRIRLPQGASLEVPRVVIERLS